MYTVSMNNTRRVVLPPTQEPVSPKLFISPLLRTEPRVPKTATVTEPIKTEPIEELTGGKYRVVLLKDKCIGAASCAAVSPKAFKLNSDQIVEIQPTISTETDENLLLAAQSCPAMAIEIYQVGTGEKIWPK